MATTWLSNLFGGGGGTTSTYKPPSYIGTGSGSAYQKVVNQPKQNAYASRMTAMARYYRGVNANGVAQVRAIDNMQPAYGQNQTYLSSRRGYNATGQRYQAQVDYRNQYQADALRGYYAAGQRLTGQAADWMAQNAFNYPQQPVSNNQYAGGYGGGYGGYGDSGGATMPDWYSAFLNPMNWRI